MPNRTDWLLLALAHRAGRQLSPAQIQKAMFLVGKELPKAVGPKFYRFVPYNYGPFDVRIYHDLDMLALSGQVAIVGAGNGRSYTITPSGLAQAEQLEPEFDQRAVDYLRRVVDWISGLSFPSLIRAIYARYPEFKVNSVFVD